jgi:hypothetical protein
MLNGVCCDSHCSPSSSSLSEAESEVGGKQEGHHERTVSRILHGNTTNTYRQTEEPLPPNPTNR